MNVDINSICRNPKIWKTNSSYCKDGYWLFRKFNSQGTIPNECVAPLLGIEKEERVLVFAGCYGDWAGNLASNGIDILYNDISEEMGEIAKSKGCLKQSIENSIFLPRHENEFDWSFSFEPIGFFSWLPLTVLRSLLNKRGCVLVTFNDEGDRISVYHNICKTISSMYNLEFEYLRKFIPSVHPDGRPVLKDHHIFKIITNPKKHNIITDDLNRIFNEISNTENKMMMFYSLINEKHIKRTNVKEDI